MGFTQLACTLVLSACLPLIVTCQSQRSSEDLHQIESSRASLRERTSTTNNASVAYQNSEDRAVYLVMNVRLTAAQIFPPKFEKLFPAYAALHFNGTSTDGPIDIQLVNKDGNDLLRVTDLGLSNKDQPMGIPQHGYLTDYFELFGQSNVTNNQILDTTTGEGLVHDVWMKHSSLALKSYNSVDLMQEYIAQLGLGIAPSSNASSAIIPTRLSQADSFWRNIWVADKKVTDYKVWKEIVQGWGSNVQKARAEFNYKVSANASAGMTASRPVPLDPVMTTFNDSSQDNGLSSLAAPNTVEVYQADKDTLASAPEYLFIYAQSRPPNATHRKRDDDPPPASRPKNQVTVENPDGGLQIAAETDDTGRIATADVTEPENRVDEAVISRTENQRMFALVRPIGGFAAGAVTVVIAVIDFTHKDAVNTICAAVSLTAGLIGAVLMMLPPYIGDIAMLASVFLAIVPNIPGADPPLGPSNTGQNGHWKRTTSTSPTPPLKTDIQGILQYTIVGDRNKTGNEKCQSKGYKDCRTVYGPYFLASAFKMEIYDAFALLIHFNEGFPMSIFDLAKAFTLSSDPDSTSKVATIDCSHSTKPNLRFSWSNPNTNTILSECDNPIFSIKRQLINVPIINETADQVYERLMPHGNCTLIGDVVGGERFPAYNITLKGGAVAIGCGIVGAIDVNGTAVPIQGPTLNTTSLVNPGNQSSDGSSGRGYIAPPPPSPFQSTLNLTNSIYMASLTGSSLWLPNGTYSEQSGSLGFDSTKAVGLSLLSGSSLKMNVTEITQPKKSPFLHDSHQLPIRTVHEVSYTTNQSANDGGNYTQDMQNIVKYNQDNTFTVNVPLEPDAACFYQQPRGKGDFACFGPGGGDLPEGLKGKSRSVKAFGRASVEIFAESYGNSFAHIIDTEEDDLAQIKYDDQSTFADKATSMWVYLEPLAGS